MESRGEYWLLFIVEIRATFQCFANFVFRLFIFREEIFF